MGLTGYATLCNTKHTGQTKGKQMQLEKTQSYGSVQTAGKIADKLNTEANQNIWEVKRLATNVSIVWYLQNTLTNQIHDYKK